MALNFFSKKKVEPEEKPSGTVADRVSNEPTSVGSAKSDTPKARNTVTKKYTPVDPMSSTSGMNALASMYTSPEEEERMRRASVANMKILAVGDALRHIGNIYNTVHGAPGQKLSSPVLEEQQRYLQGKALRDTANARFFTYQQQRAQMEANAKRLAADQQYKNDLMAHYNRQEERLAARDAETARRNSVLEFLREQELELKRAFNEKKISIAEFDSETRRINAMRARATGGKDFTTTITYEPNEYDPNTGKMIKRGSQKTERKYGNGNSNGNRNLGLTGSSNGSNLGLK